MRVLFATLVATLILAAPASAGNFGELFPNLPDSEQHSDQDISDLAQSMLDPNLDARNNCDVTTPPVERCTFSGYTYAGGQFVDHDITLDKNPSPTSFVDPRTLTNFRTFKLDLDSMYGGGPEESPQLYEADLKHFRVDEVNVNGVRDLPRNPDGTALLVEPRNDENQIILQVHIAFEKAHNRLVDEGHSFEGARRKLLLHYQKIVVDDVLRGHQLSRSIAANPLREPWVVRLALRQLNGMTPIEFSGAGFRDGHSKVRRAYRLNETNNCANLQVFNLANQGASLVGGRPLQAGRQINWGMFFEEFGPEPPGCEGLRNIQRRTDSLISSSLFQLPNPFVANASNVLAFLNMRRAQFYGMASGEDIAREMGLPVLTPAELGLSEDLAERFKSGTPAWFYILKESELREDGQRLGPVGSRIVASSFLAMLWRDDDSILRRHVGFRPDPRIVGTDGKLTLSDIFTFARV